MPALNSDLFKKKRSNFSTTLNGSIGSSDTTIALNSTSGLPTDTAVLLTIDRVDSNGSSTPTKMERVIAVVSGNNLTNVTRGTDNSPGPTQSHASGAVVEDIWDAMSWNDALKALLVEHNQDGTHNINAKAIGAPTYVADTGTANTYAATLSPALAAYAAGNIVRFKAANTNTGASTLNVNALGAKAIKKLDGATALAAGDIIAGQIVCCVYDGTNFQMVSPLGAFQTAQYIADSGTANAYVATLVPALTSYVTGTIVQFKAANSNTTASTLNVNGLGAKAIKKLDGATALVSGDIVAGQIVSCIYDGTNFQMVSPIGQVPAPTQVNDSNGLSVLLSSATTSAVNQLTAKNAAASSAPELDATGTDTNIDMKLKGKGTGATLLSIRRQGGSSSDWSSVGTTNFAELGTALIQAGVFATPNASTAYTVTFPQAFSQPPIVVATCNEPNGFIALEVRSVTASNFVIVTNGTDASNITNWIAIGPR